MVIPSRTGSMVTKLLLSFLTCAVKSFTACQYVCACAYYMNMRAHARGAHVSRLFAFVRGSVQTFPSRPSSPPSTLTQLFTHTQREPQLRARELMRAGQSEKASEEEGTFVHASEGSPGERSTREYQSVLSTTIVHGLAKKRECVCEGGRARAWLTRTQ